MRYKFALLTILMIGLFPFTVQSQVNEDKLGAWYMYFWNTRIGESQWGFQGDIQHRNFNLLGDLEQLLLRGGVTFSPKGTNTKFTIGYGHITSGTYGSDSSTSQESRIYEEALLPQKIGNRFHLTHRFRFEQRFVETQDFRTRFRYNLFINVPLNRKDLHPGAIYLALYNELFINGQRNIGNGRTVEVFDRNRAYAAIGYSIVKGLRTQLGVMEQTTNSISKRQLQVSFHHTF